MAFLFPCTNPGFSLISNNYWCCCFWLYFTYFSAFFGRFYAGIYIFYGKIQKNFFKESFWI